MKKGKRMIDHRSQDKIKVEPGADKRLANILKKALNTPPKRRVDSSGTIKSKTKPAR